MLGLQSFLEENLGHCKKKVADHCVKQKIGHVSYMKKAQFQIDN